MTVRGLNQKVLTIEASIMNDEHAPKCELPPWYESESLKKIVHSNLMELLEFHQKAEWNALDRFGFHFNVMLSLLTVVLASGVTAASSLNEVYLASAIIIWLPVGLLGWLAVRTLDRYYVRFLESAVVQRKIRYLEGLGADEKPFFKEDTFLEVARRGVISNTFGSSRWIFDKTGEGHNRVALITIRAYFVATIPIMIIASLRLSCLRSFGCSSGWRLSYDSAICMAINLVLMGIFTVFVIRAINRQRRQDIFGI